MVEETQNTSNKSKLKTTNSKPRSVYFWSVLDVQKWFRKHCFDYSYNLYVENFIRNDITGRSLIRMTDNSLLRLGIEDPAHREGILGEILKLKLKMDLMEIMDLQRRNTNNMFYQSSKA